MSNYRNYSQAKCLFDSQCNVITGINGAGKTSLIDAIYYLCNGKSYFSYKDQFLYRHETGFFHLRCGLLCAESRYEVQVSSSLEATKKITVDDKKMKSVSEHLGRFPAFMIAPKDILIILESAVERRRLMDKTLSKVDKTYLKSLLLYNRLLKQRNAVLKSHRETGRVDQILLEALSVKMEEPATYLYNKRKHYLEASIPIVNDLYLKLSGGNESVSIAYQSQLSEQSWSQLIATHKNLDLASGKSNAGIHKDDMTIMLDGKPIKKYASQGQLKSSIIAIKLAQLVWVRNDAQKIPILLLDDIFDKLDSQRVYQFLDICHHQIGAQVFITDTEDKRVTDQLSDLNINYKTLKVDNGTIT